MLKILVVEDNRELRELFCKVLTHNGYHTVPASDGMSAWSILENQSVNLIISDIMMPNMDGLEFSRSVRNTYPSIPIIIVSARDSFNDKKEGFRSGIDDYMVKPIDVNELLLRIEAVLRRSQMNSNNAIQIGNLSFDPNYLSVSKGKYSLDLPQKEFYLLYKLVSSPNRIFTRRQIMEDVWDSNIPDDTHTLDVHISRLKKNLKDFSEIEIVTVRGLGYKAVIHDEQK